MTDKKSEMVEVPSKIDIFFDSIAASLFKKRSTGGQILAQIVIFIVIIACYFLVKSISAFVVDFFIGVVKNVELYQYREYLTLAVICIVCIYPLLKFNRAVKKVKKELDSSKSQEELNIENKKRRNFILCFVLLIIFGVTIGSLASFFGLPFSKTETVKFIHIVPVGMTEDNGSIEQLQQIFKEEFPGITTSIEETISLPPNAFDAERNRHNAEVLLQELQKMPYATQSEYIIGITPGGLFTPDLNFVFSSTEDNIAIFTTSYLSYEIRGDRMFFDEDISETLVKERMRKTVMRIVGVMAGLHVRMFGDFKCVMRFSNSLIDLDAKGTEWCGSEKEKILQAQELSQ